MRFYFYIIPLFLIFLKPTIINTVLCRTLKFLSVLFIYLLMQTNLCVTYDFQRDTIQRESRTRIMSILNVVFVWKSSLPFLLATVRLQTPQLTDVFCSLVSMTDLLFSYFETFKCCLMFFLQYVGCSFAICQDLHWYCFDGGLFFCLPFKFSFERL